MMLYIYSSTDNAPFSLHDARLESLACLQGALLLRFPNGVYQFSEYGLVVQTDGQATLALENALADDSQVTLESSAHELQTLSLAQFARQLEDMRVSVNISAEMYGENLAVLTGLFITDSQWYDLTLRLVYSGRRIYSC